MFPETPTRITQDDPPQYQVYVLGFDPHYACWLEGEWVTVSKERWEERHEEWERLYGGVLRLAQRYCRQKALPIPKEDVDLTDEAQARAFRAFSGDYTYLVVKGRAPDNVRLATNGRNLHPEHVQFLRKNGLKLVRRYIRNGKLCDLSALPVDFPEDLVTDILDGAGQPVDWKSLLAEHLRASKEQEYYVLLEKIEAGEERLESAVDALLGAEMSIIIGENGEARGDSRFHQRDKEEYIRMREALSKLEGWEALYLSMKEERNTAGRERIASSGGSVGVVIPPFNPDGTHGPVGMWDLPWDGIYQNPLEMLHRAGDEFLVVGVMPQD